MEARAPLDSPAHRSVATPGPLLRLLQLELLHNTLQMTSQ